MLSVDDEVLKSAIKADRNSKNYRYDVIVIGSGIGGLVAATQLAVKGARVLVLEKYVIPGGSSGFYQRDGYTFDVGSSVMFGFSEKVSTTTIIFLSPVVWADKRTEPSEPKQSIFEVWFEYLTIFKNIFLTRL